MVTGRVNDSTSALHIDLSDGTPFTFVRPNKNGKFSFRAPKGEYVVRHVGSASRSQIHNIKIVEQSLDLGQLELPPPANVALPQGLAMRLIFKGLEGTADPDFADTLTGFSVMDDNGERFKEKLSLIHI